MNPMIALPFEGGHVALQPDDRGWCDVTIMTAGRSRRFGAEGIGAIARHILGRLPHCDAIGEIEGVPVINLFYRGTLTAVVFSGWGITCHSRHFC
jgi:hypothetical protein